MPIESRYRHTFTVKRLAATGGKDADGHAITAETTVASDVPGLVQPRTARELAQMSQAGVVVGQHVGFMDPLDGLDTDCWIVLDGERYDVVWIPDAAGLGHHLEVGLQKVAAP